MAERVDITLPNKINDVGWLNSPNPLFDAQRLFDAVAKPRWLSHDHPRDGGLTSWMLSSSEHCKEPMPEAKRGHPQRYCSDRCRQAHRKIALRTGNDFSVPKYSCLYNQAGAVLAPGGGARAYNTKEYPCRRHRKCKSCWRSSSPSIRRAPNPIWSSSRSSRPISTAMVSPRR